ncbi:prophage tail fiber N-terminal domain-containing protein [Escherichia coli]|nr:prophage tail fiber N-terminal domain-containing protein [Escherichia coli]
MSVLISGALINGAGVPMAECKIYLDALVNTSEVVTESFAVIETDAAGQYAFEAQKGKYTVHIKQKNGPKCCVGDIAVYDDSKPGTLNDFLTALDESDLKPDVVKRFEELAQQAQQSAEAAAESEQASDTARSEAINAAKNARLHRNAASSAAASAEQSANVALGRENNAAEYARQAKASQDASAGNAQEAKQHRDEAQRIVDDLKGSNASTTEKGLVQLCSDTDNDSEELAATPKAVKAVMDETKTKAPLDSPAFTGTPTTPTPPDDAAGLETANAAFVRKLLAALVGSSPEALDTLNELAAALGHDPNFATTITNALAGKQPLNDVLTAVSQITPEENTLPYFSEEGRILLAQLSEKARALLALDTPEAMRTELELKAAATMESQSDIRDRTPGRLALPGAYGYGRLFAYDEHLYVNDEPQSRNWIKSATPGRYALTFRDVSWLLPGVKTFSGIIDVLQSPFTISDDEYGAKNMTLVCYNQRGDGENSIHIVSYSVSGDELSFTSSTVVSDGLSLARLMLVTTGEGPSSWYRYPDVGAPVLAVYQGTAAGDNSVKIGLGDTVPGSRLGPVSITCAFSESGISGSTPSVNTGGAGAYSFPGRYQALSGWKQGGSARGCICLFVRIE